MKMIKLELNNGENDNNQNNGMINLIQVNL